MEEEREEESIELVRFRWVAERYHPADVFHAIDLRNRQDSHQLHPQESTYIAATGGLLQLRDNTNHLQCLVYFICDSKYIIYSYC